MLEWLQPQRSCPPLCAPQMRHMPAVPHAHRRLTAPPSRHLPPARMLAALWVLEAQCCERSAATACLADWVKHLAVYSPQLVLQLTADWKASFCQLRRAVVDAQVRWGPGLGSCCEQGQVLTAGAGAACLPVPRFTCIEDGAADCGGVAGAAGLHRTRAALLTPAVPERGRRRAALCPLHAAPGSGHPPAGKRFRAAHAQQGRMGLSGWSVVKVCRCLRGVRVCACMGACTRHCSRIAVVGGAGFYAPASLPHCAACPAACPARHAGPGHA